MRTNQKESIGNLLASRERQNFTWSTTGWRSSTDLFRLNNVTKKPSLIISHFQPTNFRLRVFWFSLLYLLPLMTAHRCVMNGDWSAFSGQINILWHHIFNGQKKQQKNPCPLLTYVWVRDGSRVMEYWYMWVQGCFSIVRSGGSAFAWVVECTSWAQTDHRAVSCRCAFVFVFPSCHFWPPA